MRRKAGLRSELYFPGEGEAQDRHGRALSAQYRYLLLAPRSAPSSSARGTSALEQTRRTVGGMDAAWRDQQGLDVASSRPPRPRTYQVPKQEDDDAHDQRAQPEETQVPVALSAETSGSDSSARLGAPLLTKFGTLPPPRAPPSSPLRRHPRSPLADGRDHGEVEPVMDDAIPVTDHDAVRRAQVGLALPVWKKADHTGLGQALFRTPSPGDPAGAGAAPCVVPLRQEQLWEQEQHPCLTRGHGAARCTAGVCESRRWGEVVPL